VNGYLVGKCYYSKVAPTKFFNLRPEPYALSIILHLFSFGLLNDSNAHVFSHIGSLFQDFGFEILGIIVFQYI